MFTSLLAALLLAVLVVQTPAPDPLATFLTYSSAFLGSALLGAAKKYTGIADTWLGAKLRPAQPLLVFGLSYLLPRIIHGTPNTPDPGMLAQAPAATLAAVFAAEALRRLFPAAKR